MPHGHWQISTLFTIPTHKPFAVLFPPASRHLPVGYPVHKYEVYYLFRDQERGSKVSMYYTKDIQFGEWHVKDLTDFAVNAWEPSHDTELWKMKKQLHIYVQDTRQGDGNLHGKQQGTCTNKGLFQ